MVCQARKAVQWGHYEKNPPTAATLLDKTIVDCRADTVSEITTLGKTLPGWRTAILNRHLTGASNSPTEGLNLLIK